MTHPTAPERERKLAAWEHAEREARRTAQLDGPPPGLPYARYGQPQRPVRKPQPTLAGHWRQFTRRYGWRAWALPVLVLLTVLAVVKTQGSSDADRASRPSTAGSVAGAPRNGASATGAGPAVAAPSGQLKSDESNGNAVTTVLPALALPPGPAYSKTGTGTYTVIPGSSKVYGKGTLHRFTIEVENGITGIDKQAFAATVMQALTNSQSWIHDGTDALQRVDSGQVDFRISLTSSMSVRNLCGYDLPVETSCYDGQVGRVVLNDSRWIRGAKVYAGDLATYRLYAVNHEVGHALGHNHSHECLASGIAPVMMQQTIGTKTASGAICTPNPWPYPNGVTDAPGQEEAGDQPDLDFYTRNSR